MPNAASMRRSNSISLMSSSDSLLSGAEASRITSGTMRDGTPSVEASRSMKLRKVVAHSVALSRRRFRASSSSAPESSLLRSSNSRSPFSRGGFLAAYSLARLTLQCPPTPPPSLRPLLVPASGLFWFRTETPGKLEKVRGHFGQSAGVFAKSAGVFAPAFPIRSAGDDNFARAVRRASRAVAASRRRARRGP